MLRKLPRFVGWLAFLFRPIVDQLVQVLSQTRFNRPLTLILKERLVRLIRKTRPSNSYVSFNKLVVLVLLTHSNRPSTPLSRRSKRR